MSTTYPIKNKKDLEELKNYYLEKENLRNYTLIILGLNTALRISDILKLKWKDVYCEQRNCYHKYLDIMEQKTGKNSVIALNASVTEVLELYRRASLNGDGKIDKEKYLFESFKNKNAPISRCQAYRIIKEAANHIGLEEHISCHSLRKTFGYYAWKQGISPAVLMNIYNHSSFQITKRYLGIDQEDRDEVFMKITL